jgi:hypothetical protein
MIRQHLGVEPGTPDGEYYHNWFGSIGFRLATGKTFLQIRTEFIRLRIEQPAEAGYYARMIEILDYMDETFTSDSWYASKVAGGY